MGQNCKVLRDLDVLFDLESINLEQKKIRPASGELYPSTILCFTEHFKYFMGLTKAVFTLGLDYDRIIIELNMKWVHIN